MKLTEEQKLAIITTINIVTDICEESPNSCEGCPFLPHCQHSDESIGNYLENIFKNLLTNNK